MAIVPPDISVVVLTYNRPDELVRCVESVPNGVELVVADDGTTPSPSDRLPENVDAYHWQENKGNRASTARNKGFELTSRPKVLFLDDDVELHPLALAAHSIALEMYDVSFGLLPREKWEPYSDDRMLFYMRDTKVGWNWCWSGNLAVRRGAFESVGGFDAETYNGGHGYEDIDLARRMYLAGCKLHFNRLAMAHHPHEQTYRDEQGPTLRNQERYEEKWDTARIGPAGLHDD